MILIGQFVLQQRSTKKYIILNEIIRSRYALKTLPLQTLLSKYEITYQAPALNGCAYVYSQLRTVSLPSNFYLLSTQIFTCFQHNFPQLMTKTLSYIIVVCRRGKIWFKYIYVRTYVYTLGYPLFHKLNGFLQRPPEVLVFDQKNLCNVNKLFIYDLKQFIFPIYFI